MTKLILKKMLEYGFILFLVSAVVFFMIHLSPADPMSVIIGGKGGTPELIANARAKFHLVKPVWQQYLIWLGGVLSGDFGTSYKFHTPVLESIAMRAPVTLGLTAGAAVISVGLAVPLGIISAVKKDTWIDGLISILSLFLAAVPSFLLSIVVILVLSRLLPSYPITGGYKGLGGYLERLLFPCLALACSRLTVTLKVTRLGMTEQLGQPYIQNAVARGIPRHRIIVIHALKNGIIPVIAILSVQIGAMIVGAVLVESVFSLSGVGTLLIDSIKAGDHPVIQAIILLLVTVFLAASAIADILYAVIDPRIRSSRRGQTG